ncbi:MAG: hypothetical protein AAF753_02070 [Pseudomonadota bacterium]
MNDVARYALGRVWQLVASALETLTGPHRPQFMGRAAWACAFRELRVAEAAARRAILVMAAECPVERPPLPSAQAPEPRPAGAPRVRGAGPAARGLKFRLSDPIGPAWPAAPPGALQANAPGPGAPVAGVRRAAGLWARVDALAAVLDDPAAAVERVNRLRARPRRHIFARSAAPRLRPGRPPGHVRARWLSWDMDVLMEIHTLAIEALNTPPARPGELARAPCAAA